MAPWITPAHAPPTRRDGFFVVTRYADVLALQRHRDLVAWELWLEITRLGGRASRDYSALTNLLRGMLPNENGAEHAAFRSWGRQALGVLAPAFEPAAVTREIQAHLRAARVAGDVDAMESLCRAIPTAVMAGAMGLAPRCVAAIRRASTSIFAVYEPGLSLRLLDAIDADARAAHAEIVAELARARSDASMGLARLVALMDTSVDEFELTGFVFFLTLAAVETVTGLLGSLTLLLLTFPAQWQKLASDPTLAASCTEEAIRFAGPVRWLAPRTAREDVALAGVTIPAGAIIMQELEQANHDPQVFEQPETFDITRAGRAHMGFGVGLHACLGASLGRLQARLYLQALLEAGRVELLEENPAWERHSMFRRLARLPLRFS